MAERRVASERDLVRTGVSGLDPILSSGIPRRNVILVEGAIGTGKTTLGVEFVYHGATSYDEPGIIVLFEVSPDKLACGLSSGAATGRQSAVGRGREDGRSTYFCRRRGRPRQWG